MKLRESLKLLFMVCIMILAASVTTRTANAKTTGSETVSSEADSEKDGWKGDSYYRNGKAVNGWQTIDGYTYYFKKHKIQRNTIAGTKASGRYYVGPDGIKVDDPTMNRIVKFVLKNSKTSDSRFGRLKSCCAAIRKYYYFHMSNIPPKASKVSTYADYMLTNHRGNCYRYAVTMSYVATALGFKARLAAGGVSMSNYSTILGRHGWCEIKTSQGWKIWDLSLQRKTSRNLLNILRKDYPYRLRATYLYTCRISKGKITWIQKSTNWSNTWIKAMW